MIVVVMRTFQVCGNENVSFSVQCLGFLAVLLQKFFFFLFFLVSLLFVVF